MVGADTDKVFPSRHQPYILYLSFLSSKLSNYHNFNFANECYHPNILNDLNYGKCGWPVNLPIPAGIQYSLLLKSLTWPGINTPSLVLTLSQTSPCFYMSAETCIVYRVLKTQWEKEILLGTSNFSFSHSVFYLLENLMVIKLKIVVCKLFHFGSV